jgi:hypothetical protein
LRQARISVLCVEVRGVASGPLFEDDFGDPTSGWPVEVTADSSVGYVDDEYAITLDGASRERAGIVWREGPLPNVALEVNARLIEGSGQNTSLGVGCWDHEADEGYVFAVSEAGYAILWFGTKDVVELASGPLVQGQVGGMHRIRAVCLVGFGPASFTLELDGRQLAQATQPEGAGVHDFTAMVLIVGTDTDVPVEARFDDALARAVTPS